MNGKQKINVFGVNVDDISLQDATAAILKLAEPGSRENYVVTVNSEFVMKARHDPRFMEILNSANLAVADGWWVVYLKLICGGKSHVRITGIDLVKNVCRQASKKPITIGFLGGFRGIAAEVAKRQKLASRSLSVVYAASGDETISLNSRLDVPKSLKRRIDILFVALGMGKQEFWIEKWKKSLDVGVFIGVGGAFDYIAGVKKRAPVSLQNSGFEWLWRLAMEPARAWRMRVLPIFFVMICREFLRQKFFNKKK